MDVEVVRSYVAGLAGVSVTEAQGDFYFFLDPKKMMPFVTIVTGDRHDKVSNLDRPGVYRVNIGLSGETFRAMFGAGDLSGHDFAALDVVMPHPVYAAQFFVCVLNPDKSWEQVKGLIEEGYAVSMKRYQPDRKGAI